MEKAYDFKALVSELKGNGVEIAEESAKVLIVSVFSWLEKSAPLSENKVDDMLVALYPIVKKHVLDAAENINKEDNK